MTFSSVPFLFYFLPLFLAVYFASPFKNTALLAGSLLFYAWGEPVYIILLVGSLVINHWFARKIARSAAIRWLWLAVGLNLSLLAVFKYAGFLGGLVLPGVNAISGTSLEVPLIGLPIGISFYTFQALSLQIDLYRRAAPEPRRFVDTALYISMFPQLIAGPIVRYKSIADQLIERDHNVARFADGARLFMLGLAQKVLLANLFAEVADAAFGQPFAVDGAQLTVAAAWVGLLAYTLQIYFDFAGYSNMAIGLGRLFGFDLPRNFDFPYVAQSVSAFWRRWHITLSQWFRDYLYIPLGGNRGSLLRTSFNLWAVFLLCGLWHGAALAFVFWGAYHGFFLVLERAGLGRVLSGLPRAFRHLYLWLVVSLGWVPFRTENLADAVLYYRQLFGLSEGAWSVSVSGVMPEGMVWVLLIGAIVALWPLVQEAARWVLPNAQGLETRGVWLATRTIMAPSGLVLLFFLCTLSIVAGGYNPFIYFRF